jgi:hypothetical protein
MVVKKWPNVYNPFVEVEAMLFLFSNSSVLQTDQLAVKIDTLGHSTQTHVCRNIVNLVRPCQHACFSYSKLRS